MRKFLFISSLPVLITSLSLAQITASGNDSVTRSSQTTQAPLSYGSSTSLSQLEQVAQTTINNLGHTRIDKWKVSAHDKDQARSNMESLQRNLTTALPALIQQVRANPSSLVANIKLYRNLNALYDVLSSFSESAGAFGTQEDYNALARDSADFDTVRRSWADQLEQLAAAQDAQIARLTEQAKAQQPAPAAAPPMKKIVVDDNASTKKPATTKKKTTTSTTTSKTPSPQ